MFETFNFSVLDDPSFKEDSVREEIIAPILRKIGYRPSGEMRVTRSKALTHPFVMIGSRKHPVNIIPDYTLYKGDTPVLVLDAKGPSEPIIKSHHVEQVYSYAIHPEIRVRHYALCNGRELVVYLVDKVEPLLKLPIPEVDTRWKAVVEALDPRFLLEPDLRGFHPDYGLTIQKMGVNSDVIHIFPSHYLQDLNRVTDSLVSGCATTMVGSLECLISFDFSVEMYEALLTKLPPEVSQSIRKSLSSQPFRVDLGGKIIFTCTGCLGEVTTGSFETFVPINVSSIDHAHYDPTVSLETRNSSEDKGL